MHTRLAGQFRYLMLKNPFSVLIVGLSQNRFLPLPEPPTTSTFLFRAFLGSGGRLLIIRRSVLVRMMLSANLGAMDGSMSLAVPHEAFCQVLFELLTQIIVKVRKCKSAKVCVLVATRVSFGIQQVKLGETTKLHRPGFTGAVQFFLHASARLSSAKGSQKGSSVTDECPGRAPFAFIL